MDTVDGDEFGYAVAISGDLVLVGAHGDDVFLDPDDPDYDVLDVDNNIRLDAGSAYVFTLTPENQPPVADAGEDRRLKKVLRSLWTDLTVMTPMVMTCSCYTHGRRLVSKRFPSTMPNKCRPNLHGPCLAGRK